MTNGKPQEIKRIYRIFYRTTAGSLLYINLAKNTAKEAEDTLKASITGKYIEEILKIETLNTTGVNYSAMYQLEIIIEHGYDLPSVISRELVPCGNFEQTTFFRVYQWFLDKNISDKCKNVIEEQLERKTIIGYKIDIVANNS